MSTRTHLAFRLFAVLVLGLLAFWPRARGVRHDHGVGRVAVPTHIAVRTAARREVSDARPRAVVAIAETDGLSDENAVEPLANVDSND